MVAAATNPKGGLQHACAHARVNIPVSLRGDPTLLVGSVQVRSFAAVPRFPLFDWDIRGARVAFAGFAARAIHPSTLYV